MQPVRLGDRKLLYHIKRPFRSQARFRCGRRNRQGRNWSWNGGRWRSRSDFRRWLQSRERWHGSFCRSPPQVGDVSLLDRPKDADIVPCVSFADWPEEWQDWANFNPMERFRKSEKIFAQYLATGGRLDPDPDPTSPFSDPEPSGSGTAYWRAGLCVLRRGAV